MNTPARQPGPGARLLGEQLRLDDPLAALAAGHPPGDQLYRLARALRHTAMELDAGYARAQRARRRLQVLRRQRFETADEPGDEGTALAAVARELELAIELCEVSDTALIRLLASYQDITAAVHGEGAWTAQFSQGR